MQTNAQVYEALAWASSFLEKAGYEKEIGYILLGYHTGWNRSRLLAELRSPLEQEIEASFRADVEKAASGEPVQHITGREVFYGRTFAVNRHVLIPRPETEELVEAVLQKLPKRPLRIADIGTGSGIIAATLALEMPDTDVTAVDISAEALDMAKNNVKALEAEVNFLQGDLLEPLKSMEPFDVIISNPPYIPEGERKDMDKNVTEHEPEQALFAGADGLAVYRRLVSQLPGVLKIPGLIAFEIGHGQGEAVKNLIREIFPAAKVEIRFDMNKKERIIIAEV